ncbi:hypothetical protein SBV1_770023 [Verrucomicrobia bacterium]|nr:hypothetical protein SBV1_770023 [Verrucomicrobiota bacterium]
MAVASHLRFYSRLFWSPGLDWYGSVVTKCNDPHVSAVQNAWQRVALEPDSKPSSAVLFFLPSSGYFL